MFEGECFDIVEAFIKKKLTRLTEFESRVKFVMSECSANLHDAEDIKDVKDTAKELLEFAKKQLLSYADESNPAIEAMADLERTYFNNPDKLPKWLKDDIARRELNAHTKGYNKGYEVATKLYDESVAYHFPIMPTPPSGWGCDGTHCTNPQMDCINCPRRTTGGGFNTSSGTSTATLHGNTSATDGKEHNPSFTD